MVVHLTQEQRQELEAAGNTPVRFLDPETKQEYVILRAEAYEGLRARVLADNDVDPREAYPFVDKVMAEDDAQDPHLESYQQYRRETRP